MRKVSSIFTIIVFMFVSSVHSEVLVQHIGSTDPVDEGWIIIGAQIGVTVGPVNDSGTEAWFIYDDSTANTSSWNYGKSITSQNVTDAWIFGWTLRANLSIVEIPDAADSSIILSYAVPNEETFLLHFGAADNGDPIVRFQSSKDTSNTGPVITLDGVGPGYHLYELVYDPVLAETSLVVDGVTYFSGYTGYEVPEPIWPVTGVRFGGANGALTGRSHWNLVEFEIGTDEDGDGFSPPLDCDDTNADINPDALEIPGNFVDENCDGNLGDCDPCLDWKNHGQYVRCVSHAVEELVFNGDITEEDGDSIVSSGAQTDIGKNGYVPAECASQ